MLTVWGMFAAEETETENGMNIIKGAERRSKTEIHIFNLELEGQEIEHDH